MLTAISKNKILGCRYFGCFIIMLIEKKILFTLFDLFYKKLKKKDYLIKKFFEF